MGCHPFSEISVVSLLRAHAMTVKLLDPAIQPKPATAGAHFGLTPRSRVVRDFVLLITVCVSVGISVGLGMMVAVLAFF